MFEPHDEAFIRFITTVSTHLSDKTITDPFHVGLRRELDIIKRAFYRKPLC